MNIDYGHTGTMRIPENRTSPPLRQDNEQNPRRTNLPPERPPAVTVATAIRVMLPLAQNDDDRDASVAESADSSMERRR